MLPSELGGGWDSSWENDPSLPLLDFPLELNSLEFLSVAPVLAGEASLHTALGLLRQETAFTPSRLL